MSQTTFTSTLDSPPESPSLRECRRVIKGFVYAITKARSLIREQATPRGAIDLDSPVYGWESAHPDTVHTAFLADIDETARRYDPWLFSEECEQVLESLANLSDPTPLDVMNWTVILNAPSKRFKDDPDGPGDSLGLRLIFPSYCPIRLELPMYRLITNTGAGDMSLWDLPDR